MSLKSNVIRKTAIDIAKKNLFLRVILKKLVYLKRLVSYKILGLSAKTDDKTVFFSVYSGRGYTCSPKAIYQELLNNGSYNDYNFIWSFRDPDKYSYVAQMPRTTVVKYGTNDYLKAIHKSKYWCLNYKIEDDLYPSDNQVYIQCWHGTPLKILGCDIEHTLNAMNSIKELHKKYRKDAKKLTYFLSPSAFASEKFISAFDIDDLGKESCILEAGYPRNDSLLNYTENDVIHIKEKLGLSDSDKKIIFYAPTWRDDQHSSETGFTYEPELDFDKLSDSLKDKAVLLFRTHYLISNRIDFEKYKGFVYNVSEYEEINDLYIVSDILITDYSSVFFDYANLKRPIIFYMYDLDFYREVLRGFYLNLDELPGKIITDIDFLINEIENVMQNGVWKYDEFSKKYNSLDDGQAAKRVVETIFKPSL